jgi:hypothetical protein
MEKLKILRMKPDDIRVKLPNDKCHVCGLKGELFDTIFDLFYGKDEITTFHFKCYCKKCTVKAIINTSNAKTYHEIRIRNSNDDLVYFYTNTSGPMIDVGGRFTSAIYEELTNRELNNKDK